MGLATEERKRVSGMVGAKVRSSGSDNWGGIAAEETGRAGDSSEKLGSKGRRRLGGSQKG